MRWVSLELELSLKALFAVKKVYKASVMTVIECSGTFSISKWWDISASKGDIVIIRAKKQLT